MEEKEGTVEEKEREGIGIFCFAGVDGLTDIRTHGPMDGQTLLQRCEDVSKKEL